MVQTFQQTTEFPQLQYFPGGRCPCLQVVQILRCCLCEDSRDPTVAARLPYSSYAWFDSGYKFMRRLRWPVLLVTFHLAQCSLPLGQAYEAWRHGRHAQKDIYELDSGMSRLVLLVAMHLALCSLR